MAKKLYYIDENGNKKYYVGKIINDYITNEKYGLLTVQEKIQEEVKLEYHSEEPAIEGWSSYYTYLNENNQEVKYTDDLHKIRKNIDNSYYFTRVNKNIIDLNYHDKIEDKDAYFSYKDNNGNEVVFDGQAFYDKFTNTYYFYKYKQSPKKNLEGLLYLFYIRPFFP